MEESQTESAQNKEKKDEKSQKLDFKVTNKNNYALRAETILAYKFFQERDLIRRYNNYSKYIARKYMTEVIEHNFWKTISTALLVYDFRLTPKQIHLGICDEFGGGVYMPKEKEIILGANALINKEDFEDALFRQLIKLYDDVRSTNYNFTNGKHLAGSEVRAALFSSKCNSKEKRFSKLQTSSRKHEKEEADNYGLKTVASENLKEKDLGSKHADEFIHSVFEKCSKDRSPFGSEQITKTKSLTDIL